MITAQRQEALSVRHGDATELLPEGNPLIALGNTALALEFIAEDIRSGVPDGERMTLTDFVGWRPSQHRASARDLLARTVRLHQENGVPVVRHLAEKIDWITYGDNLGVELIARLADPEAVLAAQPEEERGVITALRPGNPILGIAEEAVSTPEGAQRYLGLFREAYNVLTTDTTPDPDDPKGKTYQGHLQAYRDHMVDASNMTDPEAGPPEGALPLPVRKLQQKERGRNILAPKGAALLMRALVDSPAAAGFTRGQIQYFAEVSTGTPPGDPLIHQLLAIDGRGPLAQRPE